MAEFYRAVNNYEDLLNHYKFIAEELGWVMQSYSDVDLMFHKKLKLKRELQDSLIDLSYEPLFRAHCYELNAEECSDEVLVYNNQAHGLGVILWRSPSELSLVLNAEFRINSELKLILKGLNDLINDLEKH